MFDDVDDRWAAFTNVSNVCSGRERSWSKKRTERWAAICSSTGFPVADGGDLRDVPSIPKPLPSP
jgi:hypothetical protein